MRFEPTRASARPIAQTTAPSRTSASEPRNVAVSRTTEVLGKWVAVAAEHLPARLGVPIPDDRLQPSVIVTRECPTRARRSPDQLDPVPARLTGRPVVSNARDANAL